MNYTIKNDILKIEINSLGAELQSIIKNGTEYLWQGDEKSWKNRATNIFPYVGRLKDGKYTFKGKLYEMGCHGFARNTEFLPIKSPVLLDNKSDSGIIFKMESSEETFNQFPFEFEFFIKYTLIDNKIDISYQVFNKGNDTMYFGLGGHPGFIVPLEKDLNFEDYFLEFSNKCKPINYLTSENGLINGSVNYTLNNDKILNLEHSLFDNDALIFENMDKKITLKSNKDDKSVEVYYPKMKYLGIWHSPKKEVNFICIEPWASLPSREHNIEDFKTQENLISLKAGEKYINDLVITIN